jgi:hypothetical protein
VVARLGVRGPRNNPYLDGAALDVGLDKGVFSGGYPISRGHHTICTKLHALMSVFKASGRDNAHTGFADVGNFVTAAHGRRRGCVTTVDHL